MSTNLLTVEAALSVSEVAEWMAQRNLERSSWWRLAGIMTERDLMGAVGR